MLADRIAAILKHLDLKMAGFERSIDVANGTIRKALRSGGIRTKTIEKIFARYPELNYDWLLTGRGTMLYTTPELMDAISRIHQITGSIL